MSIENCKKENGKYECPYCKKEYGKKGIGTHIWRNHTDEGKLLNTNIGYINGTRNVWNKNKPLSEEHKRKLRGKRNFTKSAETRKKISGAVKGKTGGIRKGGGKGKKGWFNDYWCDSSWELAFIIYNLDLGNKIERNKESFNYLYKGIQYKYYPDFIVNGEYVEIKEYENEKSKEKKKQFPYKINTYYSKEMEPILEYVKNKYGNNFVKLYKVPLV